MTSTISATELGPDRARSLDGARSAGRRLARQQWGPDAAAGPTSVEAMVTGGLARLSTFGIRAEVVRSRPNCVVVRSATRPGDDPAQGCALMTSWLQSLPLLVCRSMGTVVESSCLTRGANACIHTLLWQAPAKSAGGVEGPGVPVAGGPGSASAATGPAPIRHAPAPSAGTLDVVPIGPAGTPGTSADATVDAAPAVVPSPADELATTGAGPCADSWAGRANIAFGRLAGRRASDRHIAAPTGSVADRRNADGGARRASDIHDGTDDPGLVLDVPAGDDGSEAVESRERVGPMPVAMISPVVEATQVSVQQPDRGLSTPGAVLRRHRPTGGRRWSWARRRVWFLVLGMLAGAGGGYYAGSHHASAYSATSVLVVQSGASAGGPGSANDAAELAITDAALLPSDESVLGQVASSLHAPAAVVSHDMVAEAIAGTALIQVRFNAATPAEAIAGANDLAQTVSEVRAGDQAIANGSLTTVSRAKAASRSGSLYKDALPLGAVLGLLLGAGAALAAERADRRVDEARTLSEAAGCPVTVVPSGISPTEMARALDRAAHGRVITLVPLRDGQWSAADQLAGELASAWPIEGGDGTGDVIAVTPAFADDPDAVGDRPGPTVLIVGAGERVRAVSEVATRLRLLERSPVWSVLVAG